MSAGEYVADLRAQAERRRLEEEQRRTQARLDQRSLDNPPETRVRIWERLHQLRLPKNPSHGVLQQISQQTGLSLTEIQEVQKQRAEPTG
jgi:hypothetical protein